LSLTTLRKAKVRELRRNPDDIEVVYISRDRRHDMANVNRSRRIALQVTARRLAQNELT